MAGARSIAQEAIRSDFGELDDLRRLVAAIFDVFREPLESGERWERIGSVGRFDRCDVKKAHAVVASERGVANAVGAELADFFVNGAHQIFVLAHAIGFDSVPDQNAFHFSTSSKVSDRKTIGGPKK